VKKDFWRVRVPPSRAQFKAKENIMMPTAEQVAPHMARFLDMLDSAFRRYGAPGGLPEPFRRAVATTPRHLFVHRFRMAGGPLDRTDDGSLWDSDADPMVALADIYSDAVMTHVDAAGDQLPSTNSQPSYVLWLLSMLDLQPGHRVLEIGSGSGWLAAVMSRLIGDDGQATGIEIIPELAAQSRADLVRLGIRNVSVFAIDGAHGYAAGAPFDRVMITAASWEVPDALFDQVADGGRLLVPVELRGGGCQVTVLHREGSGFKAERAVPGWFVPLLGSRQQRPRLRFALAELPFWDDIKGAPSRRVKLPLAMGPDGMAGSAVTAFRAFLGRTAPGFAVFGEGEQPEQRPGIPAEPFGILDAADGSVALWRAGELVGYGGPGAMRSAARAYAIWVACGLPGLAEMELQVLRAGAACLPDAQVWVEKRGGTVLVWSPLPDAEDWKELLGGDA
jgi:protein-L-isoaspartate(D-aspartate) O-methyltransferase